MNDESSLDDKVTRELHLVVGEPVLLKTRSQDIIHSAFIPSFSCTNELCARDDNTVCFYS